MGLAMTWKIPSSNIYFAFLYLIRGIIFIHFTGHLAAQVLHGKHYLNYKYQFLLREPQSIFS